MHTLQILTAACTSVSPALAAFGQICITTLHLSHWRLATNMTAVKCCHMPHVTGSLLHIAATCHPPQLFDISARWVLTRTVQKGCNSEQLSLNPTGLRHTPTADQAEDLSPECLEGSAECPDRGETNMGNSQVLHSCRHAPDPPTGLCLRGVYQALMRCMHTTLDL